VGRSLGSLGIIEIALGEFDEARTHLQESLAIFQQNGDQWSIAFTLQYLGRVFNTQKAFQEAKDLYQRSLNLYREYGSQWGIAKSYNSLGLIARELKQHADSLRFLRESLKMYIEIGHTRGQMLCLLALGDTAVELETYTEARRYFHEALRLAMEATSPFIALRALVGEASLLVRLGKTRRAVELLAFTLAQPQADREIKEAATPVLARLQSDLPPDVAAQALAKGKQMELAYIAAEVLADMQSNLQSA
jgi:tetratricopeptide (TPR) repeat protein